jgi:hypothetical protein
MRDQDTGRSAKSEAAGFRLLSEKRCGNNWCERGYNLLLGEQSGETIAPGDSEDYSLLRVDKHTFCGVSANSQGTKSFLFGCSLAGSGESP